MTDSLVPSGVGEHMLTLACALSEGFEPVLAFPDCGGGPAFLARAQALGLQTHALRLEEGEEGIADWLRDAGLSLVHVHAGIAWEGHDLGRAARNLALPVVRTEHLPFVLTDEDQRRGHAQAIELVDRVITVSDAAAASYRDAGLNHDKIVSVRNGIDKRVSQRDRDEMRAELGVASDAALMLMIARFTPQKGHAVLLEALPMLGERTPGPYQLLLVGDGSERDGIEARIDELGIRPSVCCLGERRDVADLLCAADLVILPSLFEGLPLVVLEAMSAGVPVVATRIGGTIEALGDNHPWLAEPGNAASLADCLADALKDGTKRLAMAEHLQVRFHDHFTAARMAAETAAVYRSLLPLQVA
ncbi:glycosyltransferase family 4 protein [Tianweitania aestuarii]|uniref:glycosyltransferase family 4 protein n=1 Tax=Tianweitania aestuarii TaxID=2814886 RepID=UPI003D6512B0